MNRDTVWAVAEKLELRPLGLVGVDVVLVGIPPAAGSVGHSHERGGPWNSVRFRSAWPSRIWRRRRAFYEKFGFKPFAGNAVQNWLILKNGDHVIGLFQGMFEKNILTFNPGWDQNAQTLASFTNVASYSGS